MLTIELINNNIPRLQLKDSVSKALRLISDFRVTHLPVVEGDKFLGLISEDDLCRGVNMARELFPDDDVETALTKYVKSHKVCNIIFLDEEGVRCFWGKGKILHDTLINSLISV